MKGYFIFPPEWCGSHPYMSIPCIMPYLKNEFDITALDLNIEFRKYTRSKAFLSQCYEKIKRLYSGTSIYQKPQSI